MTTLDLRWWKGNVLNLLQASRTMLPLEFLQPRARAYPKTGRRDEWLGYNTVTVDHGAKSEYLHSNSVSVQRCSRVVTFTSLNMKGLSLTLNALPLAVVTFLRMTSLVLTYGNFST